MPLAIRNLSIIGYANGFTQWHYSAPTTPLTEILASGFFDEVRDMLASGDAITISCLEGVAIRGIRNISTLITLTKLL